MVLEALARLALVRRSRRSRRRRTLIGRRRSVEGGLHLGKVVGRRLPGRVQIDLDITGVKPLHRIIGVVG